MNDNDLRQILENVEVEPSARCWEAIEGNLAAGAGASAAAGKAAVGKSAAGLTSAATKAIIASVIGVAVAGAITTAVLLSNKQETKTSDKVVVVTEQVSEQVTENNSETVTVGETVTAANPQVSDNQQEVLPSPTEKASSVPQTASTAPMTSVQQPANVSSSASQQSTSAPTTVTPQKVTSPATNTPRASAATSTPTITSTKPSTTHTTPVSKTEDPVLANHNEIEYVQPVSIEIPNVFTPNGDGFNDVFVIKGIENCEKSRLLIKNRTGAVIFQTSDYQNNWNADNVSDGTYYYQFSYTVNGISQTRNGTLTIMR